MMKSLGGHFGKGTTEEVSLQACPKNSQWRGRRDVLQQSDKVQIAKLFLWAEVPTANLGVGFLKRLTQLRGIKTPSLASGYVTHHSQRWPTNNGV